MIEAPISQLSARECKALQAFLFRLCKRFPGRITQATLFGSKARGESRPWSDIDILLIVDEEDWSLRQAVNTLAARVSLEYDVLIGPRVIGQERWERMKQHRFGFYQNVAAEGIPLTF